MTIVTVHQNGNESHYEIATKGSTPEFWIQHIHSIATHPTIKELRLIDAFGHLVAVRSCKGDN